MDVKTTYKIKNVIGTSFVLRQMTLAVISAVLSRGRMPFGASPFGFAVLGVASGGDVIGVSIGLLLGLIGTPDARACLFAYAITALIRAIFSITEKRDHALFCERPSLRTVSAVTGAFELGAYKLITGDFLFYYLWGMILTVFVTAVLSTLWYSLVRYEDGGQRGEWYGLWRGCAFVSFASSLVWGLGGIAFYGISVPLLVCLIITLSTTRKYGIGMGAAVGAAAGMCVSVTYAPLFAFGAIVFGLTCSLSPFFAAVSVVTVGTAWGIYMEGVSALTSIFPSVLLASLGFFAYSRLYGKGKSASVHTMECVIRPSDVAIIKLEDQKRRIKLLKDGFSSISRMLSDIRGLGESQTSAKLFSEVGEIGGVEGMNSYVDYMSEMLGAYAPAMDCGALAAFLSGVMNSSEAVVDTALCSEISSLICGEYLDYSIRTVAFGGDASRVAVLCDSAELLVQRQKHIRELISLACKRPMETRGVQNTEGQAYLEFYPRPVLDVTFSGRKRNAVGEEEFCGDSFGVVWQRGEGKLFAFISDGMGSGRQAAATSGLCALLLQKLLPVNVCSGTPVHATLDVLNGFLRGRNLRSASECSSTIDLCRLDLVECKVDFCKCGAAPTYVFRDGSLFKLRSRTVPIGIMDEVDVGRTEMELCPGDVIVMVSDGVTQGKEEYPELFEYVRTRIATHSAEQLADAIIDFAEAEDSADDVSVVVIKVEDTVGKR